MKRIFIAALIATTALQSCGTKEEKQEGDKKDSLANNLPIVTTETAAHGDFQHYIEIQGTVQADKIANVTAETGGLIRQIVVEKGQKVGAGQTLVILDSDVISKNIEEVKKSLELANFVFEKQKNLHDQNIGSELQYQQAKNNKERLEQTLQTLEAQRSMSVITAPFDGVVDDIFPKVGEMAAPGMAVIRLINLNKVHIEADVMESYLKSVSKNKLVDVYIRSIDTVIKNAPIVRTGKFINPSNRTFKIQVDVDNNNEMLLPNMVTVLRIKHEVIDSVITVPTGSVLQSSAGVNYVYVVRNEDKKNIVKKVDVETGPSDDFRTVIYPLETARDRVADGDKVVVEGARGVKQGMEVKIKK
ncbi:MAG: efflux RND transporter periplasmic adaptor subunit [Flavobacteriales bacterium]|nr:efflux RND transporter periplasmic adaptor subunit [Flavobacteriales bacterium]